MFIPSLLAIFAMFVGSIPSTSKPNLLKPFNIEPSFDPISITSLLDLLFKPLDT